MDIDYRRQAGEQPQAEEYGAWLPSPGLGNWFRKHPEDQDQLPHLQLPRAECDRLAAALSQGDLRGALVVKKDKPVVPAPRPGEHDEPPYADPYYWAAFILLGDPD